MKKAITCIVCGHNSIGTIEPIISDALAQAWRLSRIERRQFDQRESQFCHSCKSSTRTRALAMAVMKQFSFGGCSIFTEWIEMAKKYNLRIAEINCCGCLHTYLKVLPNLSYSEYTTRNFLIKYIRKIKGCPHEDIQSLSYKDNTFDLVMHSEVLEHVPNPHQALEECKRILKPNGVCIFTIPIIMSRKTVQRTKFVANRIINLKNSSYHGTNNLKDYLVWWEFGNDFITDENAFLVLSNPLTQTYIMKTYKTSRPYGTRIYK